MVRGDFGGKNQEEKQLNLQNYGEIRSQILHQLIISPLFLGAYFLFFFSLSFFFYQLAFMRSKLNYTPIPYVTRGAVTPNNVRIPSLPLVIMSCSPPFITL